MHTYDFSSFTILVLAKSEFASQLLADTCRSLRPKNVLSKRSCAAAWDAFTTNPVDIIIGDIAFDEGHRFLKAVRNVESSPNALVPFIATSNASSLECVIRARDSGANEFVGFPLSANTLIERLIHVVEVPRVFVRTPQFLGPDRRRKERAFQGENRRQSASAPANEAPAQQSEATREEGRTA